MDTYPAQIYRSYGYICWEQYSGSSIIEAAWDQGLPKLRIACNSELQVQMWVCYM